jgi:hypothetical protein
MNFDYSGFLTYAPDTGEEIVVFRPEVPLRVIGSQGEAVYMALVDTGADNTIMPMSIARELKISTRPAKGPDATAFGGQQIRLSYADLMLEINDSVQKFRWPARVHFFDSSAQQPETIVAGHDGFLNYFRALFDSESLSLTLDPTPETLFT